MSKIKQIPISELKPGMFVHKMDISWLQNPFLRNRRRINNNNDILLLKKAGAKILSIDLEKSIEIPAKQDSTDKEQTSSKHQVAPQQETPEQQNLKKPALEEHQQKEKPVTLEDELKAAKIIQTKIYKLVEEINTKIKNGLAISTKEMLPIINDSLASIHRNDQALLTLLHVYRNDKRLTAHGFAVFSLVLMLAMKTGCSKQQTENLAMAALLHDCGWARLPMNLFGKGKNYTSGEKNLIKQHIQLAIHALRKSISLDKGIIQLIEQHHELANGKGYPQQLLEKDFHPLHNHLQVADLYDTYLHGLENNPAVISVNALKKLYKDSTNGLFSQTLVTELIQILGVYPISSIVRLTSDEIACVIEVNRKLPLLPKVKLLLSAKQEVIQKSIIVDLADDKLYRLVIKVLSPSALPDSLKQELG